MWTGHNPARQRAALYENFCKVPVPSDHETLLFLHLLRSFTTRFSFHLLLLPCFCSTHHVDAFRPECQVRLPRNALRAMLDALVAGGRGTLAVQPAGNRRCLYRFRARR